MEKVPISHDRSPVRVVADDQKIPLSLVEAKGFGCTKHLAG